MTTNGAGHIELCSYCAFSLSLSLSLIQLARSFYVHFILKPVDGDDDVIVFALGLRIIDRLTYDERGNEREGGKEQSQALQQ